MEEDTQPGRQSLWKETSRASQWPETHTLVVGLHG